MVALPNAFNTDDFPDTGGAPLIPEDRYFAKIFHSELKDTSDGKGKMLVVDVTIIRGAHQNTRIIDRFNIVNQNETARRIAYEKLSRLAEAVGYKGQVTDSEILHNKEFIIEVVTEKAKPYRDNNGVEKPGNDRSIIKRYHPVASSGQDPFDFGNSPAPAQQQASAPSNDAPAWARR